MSLNVPTGRGGVTVSIQLHMDGEVPEHCPGTTSEQAGKASACAGCPNQVPWLLLACPSPPAPWPTARPECTFLSKLALRTSNCAPPARPPSPIRTSRSSGSASRMSSTKSSSCRARAVSARAPSLPRFAPGDASSHARTHMLRFRAWFSEMCIRAVQLAMALAGMDKQVGLLDIDICGPSQPTMMGVEGESVHQSSLGWSPVYPNPSPSTLNPQPQPSHPRPTP